ncbi:MAG: hypothetical protein IKQ03_12445 [Prevotella sp.]|nr:hypothetical protein [Prevotella sp.]
MQKTIIEHLTYREELEMAVLYLNLEKLKYLVAMDIFDEDCLLSNDINETKQRYPLYVINLCYSYIFTKEPYRCFIEKNNAMLNFWHERFGLPLKNDELLENLYEHKERLSLDEYKEKHNFSWLCSCIAEMNSYKYLFNKESSDHNHYYMYSWIINDALMIRTAKTLEDNGVNLHYDSDAEYREYVKSIDENDLDEQIISFIDKHDNEGEELALYDEDKFTLRVFSGSEQYAAMLKRLLLTKHLKIRIGGNSFRVGESIANMAKALGVEDKILDFDDYLKDVQFEWGSPLIDYADKFDFRLQGGNDAGFHSKVWYYVNNVDCGWYKEDGTFCRLDSKKKGYWQIVEVIKTKGYDSIESATCALICGKDPRISGRQQLMMEEEGIDYINIFNLLIK